MLQFKAKMSKIYATIYSETNRYRQFGGKNWLLTFWYSVMRYIQVYKGFLKYVTSLSLEDQTIFSKNLQSTEFKQ